jgi:high affinity sulfate transporter 1
LATPAPRLPDGFKLSTVVPILGWIRTYDRARFLRPDVLAGLTVAAFSVPESMAYAGLAGLTPEHGLYASMLALLVYACFGTSRHMSVGTTSALSIMVAGTLGGIAFAGPDEYLAAAQLTAIFAGLIAIVAGLLKLGFVVNFISESVLTGFSTGAALFIASSQLAKLFGIEGEQGNFFERVWNVLENLDDTNGWTLALGLASIALLLVLEEFFPRLPTSLFVVILAIVVMYVTDLEDKGVAVAGDIPSGLPLPDLPTVDPSLLPALVGLAFGCFLLSYVEGVSVARTFAAREHETVDANQELYANGAINVGAGIFQGFPVGGSMSRSAVNAEAGAKSPLAGGFAAILLAVVLLFLTEPFGKLPEATLAAVVLVAIRGLIKIPTLQRLWRLSRVEFAAAALTMAGVLVFDLLDGILIGAAFSLLAVVWRVSRPKIAVLGRVPGTTQFGDVGRHPENEQIPGVLVVRVEDELFYANVEAVKQRVLDDVAAAEPAARLVVFVLANTPSLDLAGVDMLEELSDQLGERGVTVRLADTTGPVRDVLRKAEVANKLGSLDREATIERIVQEWKIKPMTPTRRGASADGTGDADAER